MLWPRIGGIFYWLCPPLLLLTSQEAFKITQNVFVQNLVSYSILLMQQLFEKCNYFWYYTRNHWCELDISIVLVSNSSVKWLKIVGKCLFLCDDRRINCWDDSLLDYPILVHLDLDYLRLLCRIYWDLNMMLCKEDCWSKRAGVSSFCWRHYVHANILQVFWNQSALGSQAFEMHVQWQAWDMALQGLGTWVYP